MQGLGGCVLFKFFASTRDYVGHNGPSNFDPLENKQVKTRTLHKPKGFGTPHGLGKLRIELVV